MYWQPHFTSPICIRVVRFVVRPLGSADSFYEVLYPCDESTLPTQWHARQTIRSLRRIEAIIT